MIDPVQMISFLLNLYKVASYCSNTARTVALYIHTIGAYQSPELSLAYGAVFRCWMWHPAILGSSPAGSHAKSSLFVCLGFNGTFSTNRLYRAITVGK